MTTKTPVSARSRDATASSWVDSPPKAFVGGGGHLRVILGGDGEKERTGEGDKSEQKRARQRFWLFARFSVDFVRKVSKVKEEKRTFALAFRQRI